MSSYLGIDVGTSAVKVVAVRDGFVVAQATRPYEVASPRLGWREIDPDTWWDASCDAAHEVLGIVDPKDVRAIGVTGQMHTVVFVGADGESVRPALMWNDVRTADLVEPVRRQLAEAGEAYLSRMVSCGSPALNLLWLKLNEPDAFERTKKFVIGPDWIVHRLTGAIGTDWCEASTSSLFDLEQGTWSARAQGVIGLPDGIYPEVRGSMEVAGTLASSASERLGLSRDVSVVVGTGDNPASAVAAGCLANHRPLLSLGTSGVLMATRPIPDLEAKGKSILVSLDGTDPVTLVQGTVQSCGESYQWWNKDILGLGSVGSADADIQLGDLGHNGVLFFPHLSGEKTIYADSSLTGAFFGLTTDVTRQQMTLAVMEGIAFGVRQLGDEMGFPLDEEASLAVVGGGSRSDVWMQVLADVLGVRTYRHGGDAGAGLGVALLAQASYEGVGIEDLLGDEKESSAGFVPDQGCVALYTERYARYLRMHDAVVHVFKDL